jgi:predicted dehydrogenase
LAPRGTEVSVVLDLMIHDLEVILHLVRSPLKELHACGVPVLSPSEDIANVRLLFENGCVANITASRVSQDKVRKIRVFQPDAYVSLDYQNQTGRIIRRENGLIVPSEVPIEKSDALERELTSFISCVRDRHEPVVGGRDAFAALKLAMEICRHIRAGGS